jgi:histidine triad (HIT) family protein
VADRCPFCDRIRDGEVRMDRAVPEAAIFPPLNPVTPGHMLVVPLRHVQDAAEEPWLTGLVMTLASRLASRMGDCNLITSIGPTATQTVHHLHIHVVPRRSGDGLALPWTGQHQGVTGERVHDRDIETAAGWPTGHEMVTQLRDALGLFTGAMPISPMQAWEEALTEARRLREGSGA